MGWLSIFSALACHFESLSGLHRDWRLRRAGAKEARLAGLEVAQKRSRRRMGNSPSRILLMMTGLISGRAKFNAPVAGYEWVRPIIVAKADKLTTATKRALLAHYELYEEFCRDD